jgi:hypothetical protein
MHETWTIDFIWWITVVELPALAGLFWFGWRNRRDADEAVDDTRHQFETGHMMLRESLAAYKLEVAKTYVSIAYLKDVESRLTSHLFRIENKLDAAGRYAQGGAP